MAIPRPRRSRGAGACATTDPSLADRLAALDWQRIGDDLDAQGFAATGVLLDHDACAGLAARYAADIGFRSRIVMARHGFGRGEYKYFDYPLPEPIGTLRTVLYPPLARIANDWNGRRGDPARFPLNLSALLARCHRAGQQRPTPLLLKYEAGDYNCLHQDLYGDEVFPLQAAFLLSAPEHDFAGGEFILVEQRPRMQSRAHVVPLRQGEGVIFAVNQRPVAGTRGAYRVRLRHGVATVMRGERFTAGVIFHDAAWPSGRCRLSFGNSKMVVPTLAASALPPYQAQARAARRRPDDASPATRPAHRAISRIDRSRLARAISMRASPVVGGRAVKEHGASAQTVNAIVTAEELSQRA